MAQFRRTFDKSLQSAIDMSMEESRGIFGSVNVDAATADNVIKQNLAALGENVAVSTHTAPHAFTVTHPLYVPCRLYYASFLARRSSIRSQRSTLWQRN